MLRNKKLYAFSILTILVLMYSLVIPSVNGAYIFEDGFETGDLSLWSTTWTFGGSASVVADIVHDGTYGFEAFSDWGYKCGVLKDTGVESNPCYFRTYVYFDDLPLINTQRGFLYFGANTFSPGANAIIYLKNTGGTFTFFCDATDWWSDTHESDPITINADTWYYFEVYAYFVQSGNGDFHLYFNDEDTPVIEETTTNGIWNNFVQYIALISSKDYVNFDCTIVDSSFIGKEIVGTAIINIQTNFDPKTNWILVDDVEISTPNSYNWTQGSEHNITAKETITTTSYKYFFDSWQDDDTDNTKIIEVNATGGTFKATYYASLLELPSENIGSLAFIFAIFSISMIAIYTIPKRW